LRTTSDSFTAWDNAAQHRRVTSTVRDDNQRAVILFIIVCTCLGVSAPRAIGPMAGTM